jgi:hypothetical protein
LTADILSAKDSLVVAQRLETHVSRVHRSWSRLSTCSTLRGSGAAASRGESRPSERLERLRTTLGGEDKWLC